MDSLTLILVAAFCVILIIALIILCIIITIALCIIGFLWNLVFAYFVVKKRDMDKWKRAYKEMEAKAKELESIEDE